MKISENGIAKLKQWEGFRTSAYQDGAGKWTIGYGSTFYADGTKVKAGDKISEKEADKLLRDVLSNFDSLVFSLVPPGLTISQYDATVCFCYNIGREGFKTSTALRLIQHNCNDLENIALAFAMWNKVTNPKTKQKEIDPGLINRRIKEIVLYCS